MSRLLPEMAFYTPLHFVVYEDDAGKTFVAYDTFVSLLAQYQREEITQAARVVEQKLEALLAAVTEVERGAKRHNLAEERRGER